MDCSLPRSLSIGFSRQEYWSGFPFPSPGISSQTRDRTQVSHIVGRCFHRLSQVFKQLDVFRNMFYDLNLLISRKAVNPIMVTSRKPFVKWVINGIECHLHQSLMYWPSSHCLFGAASQLSWGTASQAAVLILPQIKLNTQFSGCALFFSWHLRQEHSPSLTITMNHCSWHLTLQNIF